MNSEGSISVFTLWTSFGIHDPTFIVHVGLLYYLRVKSLSVQILIRPYINFYYSKKSIFSCNAEKFIICQMLTKPGMLPLTRQLTQMENGSPRIADKDPNMREKDPHIYLRIKPV